MVGLYGGAGSLTQAEALVRQARPQIVLGAACLEALEALEMVQMPETIETIDKVEPLGPRAAS